MIGRRNTTVKMFSNSIVCPAAAPDAKSQFIGVRFEESVDPCVEIVDLGVGPFDLGESPLNTDRHVVYEPICTLSVERVWASSPVSH
jgi:hypothetical protein